MHQVAAPKYTKQNNQNKTKQKKLTEIQGEINNSTIIGDFNILLSIVDRRTRQKTNKDTEDLNNTINQLDLADIYKIHYNPTITQHTFFSNAHKTCSSINYLLGCKTNPN